MRKQPYEPMVGHKFGKLTVLELAMPGPRGQTRLLVRCECGTQKAVDGYAVKSGNTATCGASICQKSRAEDFAGRVFGQLVILRYAGQTKCGARQWYVRCSCGRELAMRQQYFQCGRVVSCNIGKCRPPPASLRHGRSQTLLYNTWAKMRQRCELKTSPLYARYGAKGIKVCKRWARFENFLADMGEKPSEEYSLDRIDGKKGYSPTNCRWATIRQQQNNLKSNRRLCIKGEVKTAAEWSRILEVPVGRLLSRARAGYTGKILAFQGKLPSNYTKQQLLEFVEEHGA